jgi:hypothetical protein
MTTIERTHPGEHLLSEAPLYAARRQLNVVLRDEPLPAGSVLGRIGTTDNYTLCMTASTDGSQTPAAILYAELPAGTGVKRALAHVGDVEVLGRRTYGLFQDMVEPLKALGVKVIGPMPVPRSLITLGRWRGEAVWNGTDIWRSAP